MKLELYYYDSCFFCQKVLKYLRKSDIAPEKIVKKNIVENSEYRQELISLAGKGQVPCMTIDGKVMHESDDIIQFLKNNVAGQA